MARNRVTEDGVVVRKTVPITKARFIAKPDKKRWSVYDTLHGSWPVRLPGVGKIASGFKTEDEAQPEVDRVTEAVK